LFGRQARIARLRHCRSERIEYANVLMLFRHAPKLTIKPLGASTSQIRHAANTQQLKISQHGWTDRDQILKLSGLSWHHSSSTPIFVTAF